MKDCGMFCISRVSAAGRGAMVAALETIPTIVSVPMQRMANAAEQTRHVIVNQSFCLPGHRTQATARLHAAELSVAHRAARRLAAYHWTGPGQRNILHASVARACFCLKYGRRSAKDAAGNRSQIGDIMKSKTFVLGSALALATFAIAPTTRQASAQEDCRVYREGSQQRAACDARLSRWMIQENKQISREGANGGCGDRCEELIRQRDKAARRFESNED